MKQIAFVLTVVLILASSPVFAQSANSEESAVSTETAAKSNKLFVTCSYGFAVSWLTRIIEQSGRSNFVLRDFLPGTYVTLELQNVPIFTPEFRLTAYYPVISSFNRVPQPAKSPLHIGVDIFTGARYEFGWSFFKMNVGLGLHMFFLNTDRWNYFNMGIGGIVGIEFALSPGWSLMLDGMASYDSGNLGANRGMEPFDIVYQYQAGIGVRYSKKKQNEFALSTLKERNRVIFDR